MLQCSHQHRGCGWSSPGTSELFAVVPHEGWAQSSVHGHGWCSRLCQHGSCCWQNLSFLSQDPLYHFVLPEGLYGASDRHCPKEGWSGTDFSSVTAGIGSVVFMVRLLWDATDDVPQIRSTPPLDAGWRGRQQCVLPIRWDVSQEEDVFADKTLFFSSIISLLVHFLGNRSWSGRKCFPAAAFQLDKHCSCWWDSRVHGGIAGSTVRSLKCWLSQF